MARKSSQQTHIPTKIGVTILGFLVIAMILLIPQLKKIQDNRSHASASTTLYLKPLTTTSNPIQKTVGDNVSLDVIITPGKNLPSFIKLEILYDSTLLKPSAFPFVTNKEKFPSVLDGPSVSNGQITITTSVGPDPKNAITQESLVGTLNFTVIAPIAKPTSVSFGGKTTVLSLALGDKASENVLSTTVPTYISTISPTPTKSPSGGLIIPRQTGCVKSPAYNGDLCRGDGPGYRLITSVEPNKACYSTLSQCLQGQVPYSNGTCVKSPTYIGDSCKGYRVMEGISRACYTKIQCEDAKNSVTPTPYYSPSTYPSNYPTPAPTKHPRG